MRPSRTLTAQSSTENGESAVPGIAVPGFVSGPTVERSVQEARASAEKTAAARSRRKGRIWRVVKRCVQRCFHDRRGRMESTKI
jgi:heterodisulfide reductase subunit A-like polyferredoxin